MLDEFLNPRPSVVYQVLPVVVRRPVDPTGSPVSTSLKQDAPSARTLLTIQQDQSPTISQGVAKQIENTYFDDPCHETLHENSVSQGVDVQKEHASFKYTSVQNILNKDSSSQESSSNVQLSHTLFKLLGRWTKNHGTDISQKDEKPSKKRQNQTRDEKCCEDS
ncbi:hypothetical protein Tco_1314249 [Tanacetum coccineum]